MGMYLQNLSRFIVILCIFSGWKRNNMGLINLYICTKVINYLFSYVPSSYKIKMALMVLGVSGMGEGLLISSISSIC